MLNQLQHTSHYIQDYVHMNLSFGGPLAGRAIVKSALCLAVSNGVDSRVCGSAIAYLTRDDAEPCFGYYHEPDLICDRPDDAVLHCVAVKGSAETGLLLGYVELFSVRRVVVCLSDKYAGTSVDAVYCLDPTTGQEVDVAVDLSLPLSEIEASYRCERMPDGSVEAAFNQVLPIAMERAYDQERNRVLDEAVNAAFQECGVPADGTLNPEQLSKAVRIVAERLTPFLLHQLNRRRK